MTPLAMPEFYFERHGSERPPFCNAARGSMPMPAQQQGPSSGGSPPHSGGPAKPAKQKKPLGPQCQRRKNLKQVAPGLLASDVGAVVLGWEDCGTEEKRTVRRD
jgi:hypothetical protein